MNSILKIYSIGHGNDEIEGFIERLNKHRITMLYDVRRYPNSARLAHFKRDALQLFLSHSNIAYKFGGQALGGFREGSYFDYMQSLEFQNGVSALIKSAHSQTMAFMCAEYDPLRCHRKFISEFLHARNFHVFHILKDGKSITHNMLLSGTNLNLFYP